MKQTHCGLYKEYTKRLHMKTNTRQGQKELKCMNHDPETSKWGQYAPRGGCDMIVSVDEKTDKVLCWRCTSSSVNNINGSQFRDED